MTGWVFTASLSSHLAQLLRAAEEQQARHNRLIADGYVWDGSDGYLAPEAPSGPLTGDELRSVLENLK